MPDNIESPQKTKFTNYRGDPEVRRLYRKWRYQQTRDAAIAYSTKWNKENPSKRAAAVARNNSKRYWRNPLERKDQRLKRDYGISLQDFKRMNEEQGGLCAICGGKDKLSFLCVDHCHATGKVRGLLCSSCNRKLGFVEKHKRQIEAYLEKHK